MFRRLKKREKSLKLRAFFRTFFLFLGACFLLLAVVFGIWVKDELNPSGLSFYHVCFTLYSLVIGAVLMVAYLHARARAGQGPGEGTLENVRAEARGYAVEQLLYVGVGTIISVVVCATGVWIARVENLLGWSVLSALFFGTAIMVLVFLYLFMENARGKQAE